MKDIRLLEQNFVLLSGYLAFEPDNRVTAGGTALCSFKMGVTRRYKNNKTGEWTDDTSWVPVEVWGEAAERLKDKLKKGSPVHVEGRLKSEEYEDKQGQKRKAIKVVARRVQFLAKLGPSASSPSAAKSTQIDEEVPF